MKKTLKVLISGALLLNLIGCGSGKQDVDNIDTVKKLQTIAAVEKSDTKYRFNYKEEWVLTYTPENEFVSFEEETVANCFEGWFGEGCFFVGSVSDGGFIYDLDEHEARIYFDVETEEGHLSIISYNMDKKDFVLRVGKKDYLASEEFLNWLDEYDLAAVLEEDVKKFMEQIEENDISIKAVTELTYDDIGKYIE